MEMLSPLSRRIIAVALLLLVIISFTNLIAVPLWQWTAQSLQNLEVARQREARMMQTVSAAPPAKGEAVPAKLLIVAPTRDAAVTQLTSLLSEAAAGQELSVENIGPGPVSGDAGRISVDLAASGSEVALVKMLSDVETDAPAIRFESWAIIAPDIVDAPAKLQARAVAIWAPRP